MEASTAVTLSAICKESSTCQVSQTSGNSVFGSQVLLIPFRNSYKTNVGNCLLSHLQVLFQGSQSTLPPSSTIASQKLGVFQAESPAVPRGRSQSPRHVVPFAGK